MKKKIIALCLCIAMVTIAIASGTLAYFTDTKEQTNTFTAGNVAIKLDEAVVKQDTDSKSTTYGDLLADGNKRTEEGQDYGNLYPDQKICKDPTIYNVGSEKAYVAARITVTSKGNLHNILGAKVDGKEYDILALNEIISGGIEDEAFVQETWNGLFGNNCNSYFVYQNPDRENNTYVLYFFIKEPLAPEGKVTLFDKISIPKEWDNEEMKELEELSITVEAFGTQEYGFADCYTAMTTAFPGVFPVAEQN